jgi:uncharacterized protein YndB with AHSA1/START domain
MSESSVAPIKLKVQLPMPTGAVWYLWADPERVVTWLAARANIEPRAGGAYELFWEDDPAHNSTLGCQLTAFEPYHHLTFTWRGSEEWEMLMPAGSTQVDVRLSGDASTSTLYLTHTGWGEGEDWAAAKQWQTEAWKNALGGLKALIEMAHSIAQGQQE